MVILGGGYGGLTTALHLQRELAYNEADITLVNKHNYHYITTALHQTAAGTVNAEQIKIAINELLDTDKIKFVKAEVMSIDIHDEKKVYLHTGEALTYDLLLFALGSEVETFGIKGLEQYAFTIRSVNSVQLVKEHIDYMFAKYKANPTDQSYLTFVVGGAGFTGIEFIGELTDRLPKLCKQFEIDQKDIKIFNIEAASTALPNFDPHLIDYAVEVLQKKGVVFKLKSPIKEITQDGLMLANGEFIKAKTVIWTGGVRGNKLIPQLGVDHIHARIKVDPFLRIPGHEDVFVIGDSSIIIKDNGQAYPPTAQMAVQQGKYLAKQLISLIRNEEFNLPFKYNERGIVASLGKNEAIGKIGNWRLVGYPASFIKHMIDNRYLYSIGGLPMVIKKGKFFG